MKLSLGPLAYYWDRSTILDFYRHIATAGFDTVYLGETICSKRRAMSFDDWMDLGSELHDQGMEVVLSTLALIEAESELGLVRKICQQREFLVEANDFSAVHFLRESGQPFVTGPSVNIYNGRTLDFLVQSGLRRWVLPVELGKTVLAEVREQAELDCESEVFVYGHLPLAYSARCFTARAANLTRDDCQFVCQNHPDGLSLFSQEKQLLFNINGIQTQSGDKVNLVEEVPTMAEMGVSTLRLSPESNINAMRSVANDFRRALDGEKVRIPSAGKYCNGYWFGEAGMNQMAPSD